MHALPRADAFLVSLAVALAVTPSPHFAAAQGSPNHLYDRVQLDGSGTLLVLGANLRVDGENGQGTDLSVENDLGLSRTTFQPRFGVRWRLGQRHEIEAGFQWATRSSETVLTDTILFHDQEFPAGLRATSMARPRRSGSTAVSGWATGGMSITTFGESASRLATGYSLGFYAVEFEREGTGSGFAGIDLTGKFHYTVNGIRTGVVVVF